MATLTLKQLKQALRRSEKVSPVLANGLEMASEAIADLPFWMVEDLPPHTNMSLAPIDEARRRVLRTTTLGPLVPHVARTAGDHHLDAERALALVSCASLALCRRVLQKAPTVRSVLALKRGINRLRQNESGLGRATLDLLLDMVRAANADLTRSLTPEERIVPRHNTYWEPSRAPRLPVRKGWNDDQAVFFALEWIARLVQGEIWAREAESILPPPDVLDPNVQVHRFVEAVFWTSVVTRDLSTWDVLRRVFLRIAYLGSPHCRIHVDCQNHPDLAQACFIATIQPQLGTLHGEPS